MADDDDDDETASSVYDEFQSDSVDSEHRSPEPWSSSGKEMSGWRTRVALRTHTALLTSDFLFKTRVPPFRC